MYMLNVDAVVNGVCAEWSVLNVERLLCSLHPREDWDMSSFLVDCEKDL